jgi:flagellar basal body rod protein FlgG
VNYGMYLSASGVASSAYRQDVIANNLANSQTAGFKRTLALIQERRPEAIEQGRPDLTGEPFDNIPGGLFVAPTRLDLTQGALERSDSPLHVALFGEGFFAVRDGTQVRLTRNGNFTLDSRGRLVTGDGSGRHVLDIRQRPIRLDIARLSDTTVGNDGTISVDGQAVARLGVFDVTDRRRLVPVGGTMFAAPPGETLRRSRETRVQPGYLELANVDPTSELTQLLEAQRQLEANANMIRYQDQSLGRLVNEVGKIS